MLLIHLYNLCNSETFHDSNTNQIIQIFKLLFTQISVYAALILMKFDTYIAYIFI